MFERIDRSKNNHRSPRDTIYGTNRSRCGTRYAWKRTRRPSTRNITSKIDVIPISRVLAELNFHLEEIHFAVERWTSEDIRRLELSTMWPEAGRRREAQKATVGIVGRGKETRTTRVPTMHWPVSIATSMSLPRFHLIGALTKGHRKRCSPLMTGNMRVSGRPFEARVISHFRLSEITFSTRRNDELESVLDESNEIKRDKIVGNSATRNKFHADRAEIS